VSGDNLRAKIQEAASALIGMPLWDAGRAADLAWFAFGDRRTVRDFHGNSKEVGEFALHVQCAWRLVQRDTTVVGNRDLYYPAGWGMDSPDVPADFKWDVQGANRLDERLMLFFQQDRKGLIVDRVEAGFAGALQIFFQDETVLEIFPNDSFAGEHWRLFRAYRDEPHFVVTGKGIVP
jgi:hypothetical protein